MRVIGAEGKPIGVLPLNEALVMARQLGVDLVEIAPNAVPPVCRLVDFGKYRYELSKKDKESKKHQHANKVKEVQLSPTIDAHDFGVKLTHAIDFLCEEMKVKITLKFRGREMAHQEFGFQTVERFIKELLPFAHPDAPPKLLGRGINVMLTPLPRNKRAKNPNGSEVSQTQVASELAPAEKTPARSIHAPEVTVENGSGNGDRSGAPADGFANNPFVQLEAKVSS